MNEALWSFVGGILIGKVTNWPGSLICAGISLYYWSPEIFTIQTVDQIRSTTLQILSKN